ncbi:hypothetical protein [Pacificibacter marinus]|uniref:Uncharacterized protein n=1 Tax=Pacificibacter marinus TaxID=658057 RepID=A0A1Y5SGR0_9RHOB|nr:hypothetical protein [Pacificibacter marinus]SEK63381.1 hypothetical protein SAMN04488032_104241 [Pacificibacter marinus]SLN40487.1 hypothetical protein PAM7971_01836 [Pacificibacter marinus]
MSKTLQRIARPGLHSQKPASPSGNRAGIDVKTVQQVFATGNSSAAGKAPITIAKAPWE